MAFTVKAQSVFIKFAPLTNCNLCWRYWSWRVQRVGRFKSKNCFTNVALKLPCGVSDLWPLSSMDGLLNHLPICGKKFQESFPFQQKQNTKVKDAFSANSRMLAFRLTCKITQRWGCSDRYKGGFIYPVPRGPLSHNPSMVFYLSKEEERKEDVNNAGFKTL